MLGDISMTSLTLGIGNPWKFRNFHRNWPSHCFCGQVFEALLHRRGFNEAWRGHTGALVSEILQRCHDSEIRWQMMLKLRLRFCDPTEAWWICQPLRIDFSWCALSKPWSHLAPSGWVSRAMSNGPEKVMEELESLGNLGIPGEDWQRGKRDNDNVKLFAIRLSNLRVFCFVFRPFVARHGWHRFGGFTAAVGHAGATTMIGLNSLFPDNFCWNHKEALWSTVHICSSWKMYVNIWASYVDLTNPPTLWCDVACPFRSDGNFLYS